MAEFMWNSALGVNDIVDKKTHLEQFWPELFLASQQHL